MAEVMRDRSEKTGVAPVNRQLDSLSRLLEEQLVVINQLQERLTPVLTPSPHGVVEQGEPDHEGSSMLVHEMAGRGETLRANTDRLKDILRLLEL